MCTLCQVRHALTSFREWSMPVRMGVGVGVGVGVGGGGGGPYS